MMPRRVVTLPRLPICAVIFALAASGQSVQIQFDTLSADQIHVRLSDFKDTNSAREQELRALFEEAGCNADHLTAQAVKHTKDANVICVLPGATDSQIIVGAHFDFVNAGQGVVDNWSGCSLLPSLYQSLRTFSPRHTFVFAGFADEEKGLVGSSFYVHQMSKDDIRRARAMINLDSVGTGPTEFELDRGDKLLANSLVAVAKANHLPWSVMNIHRVGRSDSDSFQDRHIPTLMIHSITNQTWPILHSVRDQIAAIREADYYDTYRLVAAYLAYLDTTLDAASQPEK
jgi:Zn-dependent M28 family amino/carboxypeptidase